MVQRGAEQSSFQRSSTNKSTRDFLSHILKCVFNQGDLKHAILEIAEKHINQPYDRFSLSFLPLFSATVVQGDTNQLEPVIAAWQLVRLSAKLYDDVEDGDAGSGIASFTNLATSCLLTAQLALDHLNEYNYSEEQARQIRSKFTLACLKACEGQQIDINLIKDHKILDPDQWFQMTRAKSGYLFAWASWAGVVASGGSKQAQESFWDFGMYLGELIQIADDFYDLWHTSDQVRLSALLSSLPLCYTYYESNQEEKTSLTEHFAHPIKDTASQFAELRKVITESGGQKYMLAAAWVKKQEALQSVKCLSLPTQVNDDIAAYINQVFPALNSFISLADD